MELYSMLSSATTLVSFVLFVGIVGWAWSARRREAFRDAADAPFALPDEVPATLDCTRSGQR